MAKGSSSEGVLRAGACEAGVQERCSGEVVSPSEDEPETRSHTAVVVTGNGSHQLPLSRALLLIDHFNNNYCLGSHNGANARCYAVATVK